MIVGLSGGNKAEYRIGSSMMFDSTNQYYLSRSYGAGSDTSYRRKKWSFWVKRFAIGSSQVLWGNVASGYPNQESFIHFSSTDALRVFYCDNSLNPLVDLTTTAVFKDTTNWYHIFVETDTTQATASERIRIWVNGVQITSFSTALYPAQDTGHMAYFGHPTVGGAAYIGRRYHTAVQAFSGLMAEVILLDGNTTDTVNTFGEFRRGRWVPKEIPSNLYYGNSGVRFKFDVPGNLGDDSSPNSYDWAATVAPDNGCYMMTSPTNVVDSISNLSWYNVCGAFYFAGYWVYLNPGNWRPFFGSLQVSSGKWYYESGYSTASYSAYGFGTGQVWNNLSIASSGCTEYCYDPRNRKVGYNGTWGSNGSYGSSAASANTDIIGVLLDLDAGEIKYSLNGDVYGVAHSGLSGLFRATIGAFNTGNGGFWVNFGERSFSYGPPSGYRPLTLQNLPKQVITSGTFTGGAVSNYGPTIWCGGAPTSLAINGNAVTWGTHAIKLSTGFWVITSDTAYNSTGTNTWTATVPVPAAFCNAQVN